MVSSTWLPFCATESDDEAGAVAKSRGNNNAAGRKADSTLPKVGTVVVAATKVGSRSVVDGAVVAAGSKARGDASGKARGDASSKARGEAPSSRVGTQPKYDALAQTMLKIPKTFITTRGASGFAAPAAFRADPRAWRARHLMRCWAPPAFFPGR